jgi:hypothetical protein
MAIKTNSAGIITHNSEVFSERGRSFGIAALAGQPVGMRASPVVLGGGAPDVLLLSETILADKSPTYLFDYTSLDNLGSDSATLVASSLYDTPVPTPDTSLPGLSGYMEVNDDTDAAYVTSNYSKINKSQDRSFLVVFKVVTQATTSSKVIMSGAENTNSVAHQIWSISDYLNLRYYGGGSLSTGNHTDGGTAEGAQVNNDTLYIVCLSYDYSAATMTCRWKKTGDRAGHSFKTYAASNSTTTGAVTLRFIGYSSTFNVLKTVRHYMGTLYNSQTTEQEFENYCSILEL